MSLHGSLRGRQESQRTLLDGRRWEVGSCSHWSLPFAFWPPLPFSRKGGQEIGLKPSGFRPGGTSLRGCAAFTYQSEPDTNNIAHPPPTHTLESLGLNPEGGWARARQAPHFYAYPLAQNRQPGSKEYPRQCFRYFLYQTIPLKNLNRWNGLTFRGFSLESDPDFSGLHTP